MLTREQWTAWRDQDGKCNCGYCWQAYVKGYAGVTVGEAER